MELLASLVILTLLCGLVVVNFTAMGRGRQLEEGALRFETALRMARATAANYGRRVRFVFDPETALLEVMWEGEPLSAPNQFVPARTAWSHQVPNSMVRATRSRLTGPSAYRTLTLGPGRGSSEDDELEPVTFYPDGSSDSAVIELSDADGEETRRAVIELSGISGRIRTQILTAEQLQEFYEQMEAIEAEVTADG